MSRFDPDADTQARWIAAAGDVIRAHLASVGTPVNTPQSSAPLKRPTIGEAPFEAGMDAALAYVADASARALPTTSTGFMAYIPGGGLLASAIADFVADVVNRYTGLASTAPELVALEHEVIDWLADQFGYGRSATGLLTSGGSTATLLAVTRARDDAGMGGDLRRLVGYTSTQAHGSVASAFRLAGVPAENLRRVACDQTFKMRPDALEAAIAADRAAGLTPFMVVAAAGTTNTGAIDPLQSLAEMCSHERLWLHVDAAYGGAFVLCEEGRRRLAGIERAHSITFDPHKGMFLPYGTGCILLREGLSGSGEAEPYLRDARAGDGIWNPADFGLELTRPFRGLRVWLPLILHGAGAFREALAEKLVLADRLYQALLDLGPDMIEVVAAPQLSVVPFALPRRAKEPLSDWNRRNDAMLKAINGRGRSTISSTLLPDKDGDRLVARACILSHRTDQASVDRLIEDISTVAADHLDLADGLLLRVTGAQEDGPRRSA
jgi:aromatic-L-amino-acid decarboxylase